MHASLTLQRGLAFVGRHARTAEVRTYDLDGRPQPAGFAFRDPRLGRSAAAGLAVDEDGRVWVADTPASRVRVFTLFGQEVGGLGIERERPAEAFDERDAPGMVRAPTAVLVRGDADGLALVVGCAGVRRHAVQVFDEELRLVRSLRPLGDPHARFEDVRRLAARGRLLYVLEEAAERVQVFRDLEFHFAFRLEVRGTRPVALSALRDGRLIVAGAGEAPGLYLCDGDGRVRRTLAAGGSEEGCVRDVEDLAVLEADRDRDARLFALDRDGERVQVFTLEGRCHGAFLRQA